MARQPLAGQSLPIFEVWWSRSVRHTTVGKTPLDVWSARRKDLYLTTHTIHKRIRTLNSKKREAADPRLKPRMGKVKSNTHKYTIFYISLCTLCRMYKQADISVAFSEAYVPYTLPSSVEVKRQWDCISTPPVCP